MKCLKFIFSVLSMKSEKAFPGTCITFSQKLVHQLPAIYILTHFRSSQLPLPNLVPRAHVSFGQLQDTELWKLWNNQFPESKILGLPVPRRMRALVYMASNLVSRAHVPFGQHQDTELAARAPCFGADQKHVGSALSVLVMLVSRNVFHLVSALQSFAFKHFIMAYQISCRSYFGSVYRMLSLAAAVSSVTHLGTRLHGVQR